VNLPPAYVIATERLATGLGGRQRSVEAVFGLGGLSGYGVLSLEKVFDFGVQVFDFLGD